MSSHYYEYSAVFNECVEDGCRSFTECPDYAQEKMALHYWLSFDKDQRSKFLAYMEETLMDVAYGERELTQSNLEEALIDFYGPQIDEIFKRAWSNAA